MNGKYRNPKDSCRNGQPRVGPSPFMTPFECCKFDKDGKQMNEPAKPFDSAKKPWKKGGRDSGQMAYLTKKMETLENRVRRKEPRSSPRSMLRITHMIV
jgi:hypothetical protein